MFFIDEKPYGCVFKIYVLPKSSKNIISGLYGDALKIKIKAPPVDGAANKMCIEYLAKRIMVSKSSLEIISGHKGKTKLVLLRYNDDKKNVRKKLERLYPL